MQGQQDRSISLALLRFLKEQWALVVSLVLWPVLMLLCRERHVASDDPGNFVLTIRYGYDLAHMRPHAPGYPGFYVLWLVLRAVTGLSEFNILLLGNLLFTCAALILIHWSARQLFDRSVATIATLLVATNPLLLYFANTGELYAYDVLFSAFAIVVFVVRPKRNAWVLYFLYGLAGAFRLSSVILTFPVMAFVSWQAYRNDRALDRLGANLAVFALGILAWLIPFLILLHGWAPMKELLSRASSPAERFIPNLSSWLTSMLWMLNACVIIALFRARATHRAWLRHEKYVTLALLILIPSLYFALRVNSKGYTMLCLSPVVLVFAVTISKMRERRLVATLAIVVNLALFFFTPFVRPPEMSARDYAHRSFFERMQWTAYRAVSFFAPTLEHLRVNDNANFGARGMLSNLPRNAVVYFDEASVLWAFPRSLQPDYPQMTFYRLHSDDTARLFARYHGDEYVEDVPMQHARPVYYITTTSRSRMLGASGKIIARRSHLALYEMASDSDIRVYLKRIDASQ